MQFSNFIPFVSLRKKPEQFSSKFMEALLQEEAFKGTCSFSYLVLSQQMGLLKSQE